MHFEITDSKVYLNSEGKQIFIKAFYKKLKETLKYKDKIMTYEGIIRKEIYGILNHINNKEKYKAFRYY